MKIKQIFLVLVFLSGSLYAQQSDVLWDFGLKTSVKWNNGSMKKLVNPAFSASPIEVYPHFNHPKLGLLFTFYPRLLDVAFETSFGYNQFSGIIQTRNNGIFAGSDYQRDIFSLQENVKYVFKYSKNDVDYIFAPFVGMGIGFVPKGPDFNITPVVLDDAYGRSNLGQSYVSGFLPIYNVINKMSSTILTMAFGIDVDFHFDNFGIGAKLGYDLGLNNFYTQEIEYLYNNMQETKKEILKYYDSGFNFGVTLKYLFR